MLHCSPASLIFPSLSGHSRCSGVFLELPGAEVEPGMGGIQGEFQGLRGFFGNGSSKGWIPSGKLGWLEQPRMLQRLRELWESWESESRTLDSSGSCWDRAQPEPGAGAPFPLFLLLAGGKEGSWIFPFIPRAEAALPAPGSGKSRSWDIPWRFTGILCPSCFPRGIPASRDLNRIPSCSHIPLICWNSCPSGNWDHPSPAAPWGSQQPSGDGCSPSHGNALGSNSASQEFSSPPGSWRDVARRALRRHPMGS